MAGLALYRWDGQRLLLDAEASDRVRHTNHWEELVGEEWHRIYGRSVMWMTAPHLTVYQQRLGLAWRVFVIWRIDPSMHPLSTFDVIEGGELGHLLSCLAYLLPHLEQMHQLTQREEAEVQCWERF